MVELILLLCWDVKINTKRKIIYYKKFSLPFLILRGETGGLGLLVPSETEEKIVRIYQNITHY